MRRRLLFGLILVAAAVAALSAQDAEEKRDALVLYQQGAYEEAIQVCRNELEVMPKRMDAYVVMGWSQLKLERYNEALETGRKA